MVDRLLRRSGSRIEVKIEPRFPGNRLVGGKYHMATHQVYIYKEPIKQQCFQLFGSLDRLEDYIAVVCAHELGHSEDAELVRLAGRLDEKITDPERRFIALEIEENAWRYAESILPDLEPAFLDTIIQASLASYREELHSDTA
ncbi:hypothetical protein [Paenibacillus puerhi]|uniref:hypothetical protein n=1 Tax=Paenibacillus puerhi TaxID=2692622 RepID=UPI001F1C9CF7|nr:hypothetical protein [Paenibacillus puerhi]